MNKRFCYKILSAFLFLYSIQSSGFAQILIHGKVVDAETGNLLGGVNVAVTGYQDDLVVAFSIVKQDGKFLLKIPDQLEIFSLTFRKTGYESLIRDFVLADINREQIDLDFSMIRSSIDLNEVVVQTKRSPIIIKSDTIIFDIQHYERLNDQNLEDILKRIPGFKVQSDGELEYNGRKVQKVLIDGKEQSNAGAALITRSLNASQIKNVEIREKEKSDKLKNSLLDDSDFMVLDIKIKGEFNNRPFGKIRGTLGYQDTVEPGFYANGLLIGENKSFHVFAEHDRLGNEEIPLTMVRNIGNEAFAQIMTLPADFNEFKTREGYQEEMYGFKDYLQMQRSIGGFTSKIELSNKSSVFIGSYNSFGVNKAARDTQQIFFDGQSPSVLQMTDHSDFAMSKNKVEFRYDDTHVKFLSDLNFVFKNESDQRRVLEDLTDKEYFFSSKILQAEFYFNNRLEYFFVPEKWAVTTKIGFAHVNADRMYQSIHDEQRLRQFQGLDSLANRTVFSQDVDAKDRLFAGSISLYRRFNRGNFSGGLEVINQELNKSKQAFEEDADLNSKRKIIANSPFNLASTTIDYRIFRPYVQNQYRFAGTWVFTNKLAYAYYQLPELPNLAGNSSALELESSLVYNKNQRNITLSYQRAFQMFPLNKIIGGYDLLGFRDIGIPAQNRLEPQINEVVDLSVSGPIHFIGAQSLLAITAGRSFNGDFVNLEAVPIVQKEYSQLESSYFMSELQLQWPIANDRFLIEHVNSFALHRQENAVSRNTNFFINFQYYANELNLRFTPEKSVFAFDFENKLTRLDFSSEISPERTGQTMFSTFADLKFIPVERRWTLGPYIRRVWFLSGVSGTFTDVGGQFFIANKSKKRNLRITGYNLLNNQKFIRQQALPTFFEIENEGVFSRFVKVEVEFRF